jgi:hypothetical protein
MNDTTRRFSRTLGEAFKDADYAGSITTPKRHVIGFHGSMRPVRRHIGTVTYLDSSLLARLQRWVHAFILNLRSPL